jgi:ring-1,2-phenylacetyl-CoA epoxidase subunit PaaC
MQNSSTTLNSQPPISNIQYLTNYTLHLADTTHILSQRNAEWCGHGPVLEQDIALTNISLDLLGQARNFYQYAASLINQSSNQLLTEDSLAYHRSEREYKNLLLVELDNGDWGKTILRQYLYSEFQYLLFEQLAKHADEQLAAICTKALKEILYHIRWSKEWVMRLGGGTTESNERMKNAVIALWSYTGEMFISAEFENIAAIDFAEMQKKWHEKVSTVFEEANLTMPEKMFMHQGGKKGEHTEALGYVLAEMQYLQRTHPGAEW